LSDVKVRYYFNTGTQPLGFSFTCDSASIDNPYVSIGSDVTATEGSTPGTTASAANGTYYLEFSFATGTQTVGTADATASVVARYYPSTYASGTFTPTTDYSYQASDGGYAPNPHMTATLNGTLVWGEEP
jgi:hypothetical protein